MSLTFTFSIICSLCSQKLYMYLCWVWLNVSMHNMNINGLQHFWDFSLSEYVAENWNFNLECLREGNFPDDWESRDTQTLNSRQHIFINFISFGVYLTQQWKSSRFHLCKSSPAKEFSAHGKFNFGNLLILLMASKQEINWHTENG